MYGVRSWIEGTRAKGVIYTTKELEDYELMIGEIASKFIPEVLDGYHSVYLRIYQHGKKFIDVDNCFKAVQDSVDHSKTIKRGKNELQVCKTGIVNDKLFQLIVGERIIVDKAEEQRIEVLIAPYKGIFKFASLIKDIYELEDEYYENLILPEV
jgi:hypothetical protein